MAVKLEDLVFAIESMSMGDERILCRSSCEIFYQYAYDSSLNDELPEDVDDEAKYVWLPDKRELGLGKPLALAFAEEHMPRDFGKVREIFSRKGAYARFHDLLQHRGARDKWHAFEDEALKQAVRAWCTDNEVEVIE